MTKGKDMFNEQNYALLLENFFSNPSFFGGIVKYWRDEKGWSRKKLADEVNMHPSNIQRYEEGKIANIPFSVVTLFANAFNISIETFLGKEVIDKVSNMFFETYIKENDRKKERIGNLKVIENIFKKLGVRYSPDFDTNLDKIQNDLNPEFNLMYANFWLKVDLETLIFIILLLAPDKDPFVGQLITYEEANDYLRNMVEKRGDEYTAYLINQPSNFWFLISSFKYPSYNNNSTSRKRFLMELKTFLKFMKKGRLSQQECNEIADGIKMAYSLLNQFPKELNLDDNEGENYE